MPNKFCINKFVTAVDGYDLGAIPEISADDQEGEYKDRIDFNEDDENVSRQDLIQFIKDMRMEFKHDAAEKKEIIDKFHQATEEIKNLKKKLSDVYRLNIKLFDENKEATDKVNSLHEKTKRHENTAMRLIDNYEAIKKHLEGKIEEKDEIIEQKELEIKRLETQLHKTHDALHAAKKTIAPLEPESKQATHNTQRKSRKKYPGKSKGRSTAAP